MKQIELTITANSALAIGRQKPGGSVSEAMDYIPGTVIRGAIAKALIQAGGQPQPDDDFHKLFLDETPAIFINGYVAIASLGEGCYELKDDDIQVLPATALSTKNDSGFKPKKAGVFDSLIDSFCAREQGYFYQPNDLKGNAVEPMGGFYSHDGNQKYVKHSVTKRLLTRVGINRRRATAQDEILYSIEVMDEAQGKAEKREQTVYCARINVSDDDLADQLFAFLRKHCRTIRLGGSASRGLGKVKIEFTSKKISDQQAALEKRIKKFNELLKQRWQYWNVLSQATSNPTEDRLFFALTLQSDAILSENWQRTMVFSKAMLAQALDIDQDSLMLHASHSSYGYRSGWNAAWGLPKDVELITPIGSTFLFSMPEVNPCYKALAELEKHGIGQRTEEGYGQVRVCHEFHQVMREEPA
ncbi:CRISPR-associated RAMP protein Csx10 [Leptolyngbya cf. ectocarpi LEGE 11479]|uniref:CRISPR-associated RAMP protein Csx10 n=1 Tax=Leptolyngbya cf. ectocarpi LEGE 11479 TaxID=1828722 RepID=A0A928ZU65_LEPEC|nr:CRISPR-associated RAMP protein Csx10 [Leptolyngbya ectocarpi]MBE9067525.1 CRISPR-associated RAMP protein Csx10 [Leptolyngbya cf. ectocarpi LEGE 11479]